MPFGNNLNKGDIRFLLSGFIAWIVSAIILLLCASLIVNRINVRAAALGYVSSTLSFSAAIFAGRYAAKARRNAVVYTGLITAAVLVTALLTIGFLIEGVRMESAGVLSVVTFTFSGCLVGSVLLAGKKPQIKKNKFERSRR